MANNPRPHIRLHCYTADTPSGFMWWAEVSTARGQPWLFYTVPYNLAHTYAKIREDWRRWQQLANYA